VSDEARTPARVREYAALSALSEEQARALLGRTSNRRLRLLDGKFSSVRDMQWFNALAAGGTACALLDDVEAIEQVAAALAAVHRHGSFTYRPETDLRIALSRLVALAGASSAAVARLASHPDAEVRRAVAEGLPLEGPARALVRSFVVDRDANVRTVARKRLAPEELPPWLGFFTVDPIAPIAAALSAGGEPEAAALERASTLVDAIVAAQENGKLVFSPALEALCAQLPDAVLVDLARQVATEYGPLVDVSPLLVLAAGREGGVAFALATVERWLREKGRFVSGSFSKVARAETVPPSVRSRLAWAAAERALAADVNVDHVGELLALAVALFVPEELERFVALFLAHEKGPHGEAIVNALYFRVTFPLTPELERWAEAEIESGNAFASSGRQSMTCGIVGRGAADRARGLALRCASPTFVLAEKERDDARRRWALATLFSDVHDDATMGTKADFVAAMYAVERNRACILADAGLAMYALPHVRMALRRGELDFPAARVVARAVRRVYGPPPDPPRIRRDPPDLVSLDPYLGGEDVRGPLREEETRAYDRARELHVFAGPGARYADFDVVGAESARGVALAEALAREAGRGNAVAAEKLRSELFECQSAAHAAAARTLDFVALNDPALDELFTEVVAVENANAAGATGPSRKGRHRSAPLRPGAAAFAWVPCMSVREARKLLRRVNTLEDRIGHVGEGPANGLAIRHRSAVVKLAGAALVLHGHGAFFEELTEAIDYGVVDDAAVGEVAALVGSMVALSDPETTNLEVALGHGYVRVRASVAENLRPDEPAGRRLLLRLADDESQYVRETAKGVLGAGAVPWWVGIFTRDPALGLSDAEARALEKTLKAVASAIDPPDGEQKRPDARTITRLSKKLPADLACDIGRQQGKAKHAFFDVSPWIVAALPREGSERMVRDLVVSWIDREGFFGHSFADVLRACAPVDRRRFAEALFELFPSESEGARRLDELLAAVAPDDFAERIWQKIVAYDGLDDEALDALCHTWKPWLSRLDELPSPIVAWAVAEMRKLPSEERTEARALAEVLVKRAPPAALRPLAFDAVGSENEAQRRWGIGMLLGPCHDSSLDGPRAARVRAFFADEALRRDILADDELVRVCLPLARAALRKGELGFPEARRVAYAVLEVTRNKAKQATKGKKRKAPRRGSSGEPAHGLSASELRAYLAARASFVFAGERWTLSDPDIVGTTGDLADAHWNSAARAAEEGDNRALRALGIALFGMPSESILDIALRLAGTYGEAGVPETLRYALERAHEALGRKMVVGLKIRREVD